MPCKFQKKFCPLNAYTHARRMLEEKKTRRATLAHRSTDKRSAWIRELWWAKVARVSSSRSPTPRTSVGLSRSGAHFLSTRRTSVRIFVFDFFSVVRLIIPRESTIITRPHCSGDDLSDAPAVVERIGTR